MIYTKQQLIRFAHCDFAGIVFYPRYFEMLNDLVEDWFSEELNYSFAAMHENNGVPTINLQVQFKAPARIGDVITKSLWINNIGKSSLNFGYKFCKNEEILLEGDATLVHIQKIDGGIKSIPWPILVHEKFNNYLK